MTKFHVTASPTYDTQMQPIIVYKLRAYNGAGTSSVVESNQHWNTREAAQIACDCVNAGNRGGLTFSLYADD